MAEFREENDSLGTVKVPADAVYGAQTQRARDNFPISNLRFPRLFIRAMGIVKRSAALANLKLDLLGGEIANAVIASAEEVIEGKVDEQFVLDIFQTGSGTSTNMNTNEVIGNLASIRLGGQLGDKKVHPNDHVNMSQSSNDVIPTAMHISAKIGIEEKLKPALENLVASMNVKSVEFDDIMKSGRTHLMDATPVRLGQEFGGYAAQIRKSLARLDRASTELSALALGGTAVGTGINRHPDFPQLAISSISEFTGLPFREAENHFEAQSAKDAFVYAAGVLNSIAAALMKIANDIRHLSSGPTSGLAELKLPAVQPGSSIMPGKVNPVLSEAMMMACARVFGNHTTITTGGQHGNFELNVMMPVMAHAMLESIDILSGACDGFRTRCLDGIKADEDRCRELLELNPSIATALNAAVGYDKASKIAKHSAANKITVRQAAIDLGLLTDEELDKYLDVRQMTEPGIPGG